MQLEESWRCTAYKNVCVCTSTYVQPWQKIIMCHIVTRPDIRSIWLSQLIGRFIQCSVLWLKCELWSVTTVMWYVTFSIHYSFDKLTSQNLENGRQTASESHLRVEVNFWSLFEQHTVYRRPAETRSSLLYHGTRAKRAVLYGRTERRLPSEVSSIYAYWGNICALYSTWRIAPLVLNHWLLILCRYQSEDHLSICSVNQKNRVNDF